MVDRLDLSEMLYLATCNRVTFFFTGDMALTNDFLASFLQAFDPAIGSDELNRYRELCQYFEGADALQHLYEVACSLDSMVVGEREILKQLREAYDTSRSLGLTGDDIRLAIEHTVTTAKMVFTHTKIAERPVSVVSLAMNELLASGIDKQSTFLIVGAGKTNHLFAKYLLKHNFRNFKVFNRTFENAVKLGMKLNADAFPLDELAQWEGSFDVIISCTGSTESLITPAIYQKLVDNDRTKKILVDLSVPNDISHEISQRPEVQYIPIEALKQQAQTNMVFRKAEREKALLMIEEQLADFMRIFRERQLEKALNEIPVKIKEVRSNMVNNVFAKDIADMDDASREVLEKALNYMEKKCISIPITVAKKAIPAVD